VKLALFVALWGLAGLVGAQPVAPARLLVGISAPLSGSSAEHGNALMHGLRLGLGQANAAGGIGGRPVELMVRDDGGDPGRTLANTREFVNAGAVALSGYYQASASVLSLITQSGVPLVGIASGAETLRDPVQPLVFNLRAGWRDEAAAMILHLDSIGATDIAALSQNDEHGRASRESLRAEMARLAVQPVAQAELGGAADEPAVQRAVERVCRDRPHAAVLMLDMPLAAMAMQQMRRIDCTRSIYLPNEVGARLGAAAAEAGAGSGGIIVAQVVPHPARVSLPVVADYHRASTAADHKPHHASFEGYLYGRVLVEALGRCAKEPSRHCVAAALEMRPIDLGGYRVQFSPGDHRGTRFVEMIFLSADGRFLR
jgi:branched-chain amino acid transport system substrate-binding protein